MSTKTFVLFAFVLGCILSLVGQAAAKADTLQPSATHCTKAHLEPGSTRAQHCRDAGWVVRHRIVVSPRGIVRFSNLPHCSYEKQRFDWCTWNVIFSRDLSVKDGDGYRAPYWSDKQGRIHFVLGTPQRRELLDPYYVGCDYTYCGIVGPDEEDRTP